MQKPVTARRQKSLRNSKTRKNEAALDITGLREVSNRKNAMKGPSGWMDWGNPRSRTRRKILGACTLAGDDGAVRRAALPTSVGEYSKLLL